MVKKYKHRLLLLRDWRNVAINVASAVKKLYPEAEIYLIGGVAENRTTIYSDIDIAVVFKKKLNRHKRVDILATIWGSIDGIVPMYYPLEIHVLDLEEFTRIKGRKISLSWFKS